MKKDVIVPRLGRKKGNVVDYVELFRVHAGEPRPVLPRH